MSDDISSAIKQLAGMLNQANLPDGLKDIISLLGTAMDSGADKKEVSAGQQEKEKQEKQPVQNQEGNTSLKADINKTGNELEDGLEAFTAIRNILKNINTKNDPRINLLIALKPFVNKRPQKKISNCILLLQVARLLETMRGAEEDSSIEDNIL